MACFIVPGTEAIVTTIVTQAVKNKEKKQEITSSAGTDVLSEDAKAKLSTKLGWLNKMLWGGSALLAFEHIWHGEVIPVFPFLTAVKDGETAGMLQEMGTAGVTMALLVTAVWVGMLLVSRSIENRAAASTEEIKEG